MRPGHCLEKPLLRISQQREGLASACCRRRSRCAPCRAPPTVACAVSRKCSAAALARASGPSYTRYSTTIFLPMRLSLTLKCCATAVHRAQSAHRPPSAPMSRPCSWGNPSALPSPTPPAQACTATTSPPRRRDAQTASDRRASRQAEAVHSHSQNLRQMLLHTGNP